MPDKKINADNNEVRELSLLFGISQRLDATLDLRAVLELVFDQIVEHMGMIRGAVTLLNRKTGEISIECAYGLSSLQQEKGRYKLGEGITGSVVETGEPAVVPRISEEPMFLDKTGARKKASESEITYICVPVKLGSEVIGTLGIDKPYDPDCSLENDVRLLSVISSMIAQAAKLRQEAEEEKERLLAENTRLQNELKDRFQPANIIGRSHIMNTVYDQIAQVCKSNASVLILGESGTGKELVASAIHYNSLRADKPFVKVNCAALPESVLESELFGHEKGSFTGAHAARKGRFELAHGGTIFLDEIGDITPATQIKLLRVLQEREFERIGAVETTKVDVRLLAATNRNLEEMIAEGTFREDLYYRLNVFPIRIPPLRERKTDILLLADHFVEKYNKMNAKHINRISTPAIDMMMAYHWPGNVRELENCIERAVLVAEGEVIHGHHLPPTLQLPSGGVDLSGSGDLQDALDNLERDMIIDSLKTARGNRAKAARALGITERLMGIRVKKYGIDSRRFRTSM